VLLDLTTNTIPLTAYAKQPEKLLKIIPGE